MGSVVESWEMAPEPRAPKPQFPWDAAVAEGFTLAKMFPSLEGWRECFWCALKTSFPASCRGHMKNRQIPPLACLWTARTHVRSCDEKRLG